MSDVRDLFRRDVMAWPGHVNPENLGTAQFATMMTRTGDGLIWPGNMWHEICLARPGPESAGPEKSWHDLARKTLGCATGLAWSGPCKP